MTSTATSHQIDNEYTEVDTVNLGNSAANSAIAQCFLIFCLSIKQAYKDTEN